MRWVMPLMLTLAGCHELAVRAVRIDDPGTQWQGDIELTPAIHLPVFADRPSQIRIFLRLPAGARITLRNGSLDLPVGTRADRVEYLEVGGALTPVDVRGTTWTEEGELFHVLRATEPEAGAPLEGWRWPRGDLRAQAAVNDQLRRWLAVHPQPGVQHASAFVERLVALNQCASCHVHGKAQDLKRRPTSAGVPMPRRATDASGSYGLLMALMDGGPVEDHRQRDLNAEDPFVTVRCGREVAEPEVGPGGERRYRCANGRTPLGGLALAAAVAAGDAHGLAVCETRRALWQRMDEAARARWRAALLPCATNVPADQNSQRSK